MISFVYKNYRKEFVEKPRKLKLKNIFNLIFESELVQFHCLSSFLLKNFININNCLYTIKTSDENESQSMITGPTRNNNDNHQCELTGCECCDYDNQCI